MLKLVGCDPGSMAAWAMDRARADVASENGSAAAAEGLDPTDPRWVLAVRARSQLQGSLLTPERRERVMKSARALGVKPFEASMIIALVQDQARRGRTLPATAPALARIAVPTPERRRGDTLRLALAMVTAAIVAALMIRWIAG